MMARGGVSATARWLTQCVLHLISSVATLEQSSCQEIVARDLFGVLLRAFSEVQILQHGRDVCGGVCEVAPRPPVGL